MRLVKSFLFALLALALLAVPALAEDLFRTNPALSFNDTHIRIAAGNLLSFIEGAFGALVMVVAGIIALFAAVMGNYKSALSMLIVAVGAFILRSLVSLFFGGDFPTEGITLG